jgi:hypothetical protein
VSASPRTHGVNRGRHVGCGSKEANSGFGLLRARVGDESREKFLAGLESIHFCACCTWRPSKPQCNADDASGYILRNLGAVLVGEFLRLDVFCFNFGADPRPSP